MTAPFKWLIMRCVSSLHTFLLGVTTLAICALIGYSAFFPLNTKSASEQSDRDSHRVAQPSRTSGPKLAKQYGKLPMAFEANEGQMPREARFQVRGPNYALRLMEHGAVLELTKPSADGSTSGRTSLSIHLKGAAQQPRIQGRNKLPGKVNYFMGSDSRQWRTGISTFEEVLYENIYPGIDLVYYGNQQELEYDFKVSAGANAEDIRLVIDGARHIKVNGKGDLVLETEG